MTSLIIINCLLIGVIIIMYITIIVMVNHNQNVATVVNCFGNLNMCHNLLILGIIYKWSTQYPYANEVLG